MTKKAPPAGEEVPQIHLVEAGQKIWAENGYRPVDPKLVDPKQFPTPKGLFKIAKFGGWGKVKEQFFEEKTGSVAKIEEELGVSTAS